MPFLTKCVFGWLVPLISASVATHREAKLVKKIGDCSVQSCELVLPFVITRREVQLVKKKKDRR